MVEIGPCAVDMVPLSDFSKPPLTREQLHSLWKLCGPTAQVNLSRNPLWIVIVMAYYEGLAHGVKGLERLQENEDDVSA